MLSEQNKLSTRSHRSSRFSVKQYYPSKIHWQMLRKLQANFMDLETFTERWKVSHKELAQICFCSVDTVDRWFIKSDRRRQPSLHHKFFLGLTNKLWTDLLIRKEDS
jgi:hypothetical protein